MTQKGGQPVFFMAGQEVAKDRNVSGSSLRVGDLIWFLESLLPEVAWLRSGRSITQEWP